MQGMMRLLESFWIEWNGHSLTPPVALIIPLSNTHSVKTLKQRNYSLLPRIIFSRATQNQTNHIVTNFEGGTSAVTSVVVFPCLKQNVSSFETKGVTHIVFYAIAH